MKKFKKHPPKKILSKKTFLIIKTKPASRKHLATRLEHRRVEGKRKK
jgi:hypothetical protein